MFRFTIRELVLLTLVAAMGAGWFVDRWSQATTIEVERQRFQNEKARSESLRNAVLLLKERLEESGDDVTVIIGGEMITSD